MDLGLNITCPCHQTKLAVRWQTLLVIPIVLKMGVLKCAESKCPMIYALGHLEQALSVQTTWFVVN